MNIWDLATSGVWAIRPDALRAILSLAAREDITPERVSAAMAYSQEAVAARLGKPLGETRSVTVRDGVAILAIDGPIFPRSNLFSEVSGATSLEILARDLNTALDDPEVSAILLNVDSPGGEVSGVSEFAAMVYAARERKPIAAYIQDLGASAAYWITAAASPIVIADTAAVGSIGVVAAVPDPSQRKSSSIEFVSSQSPNKRPDPTSDAGRASIQAHVDEVADVFVAAIAQYRGTSVETVLADFGQGGLLVGASAVQAGLADQVGSFEQTLKDLVTGEEPAPVVALPTPPVKIPAPHPKPPARPARSTVMGSSDRWERFKQFMSGADDESGDSDTEQTVLPPIMARSAPAVAPAAPMVSEETRRADAATQRADALEAENRRLQQERIMERAVAFADKMLAESKALPAERETIIADYVVRATDDSLYGVVKFGAEGQATTRVAMKEAEFAVRAPHKLTAAEITPALFSILQGHRETPAQDAGDRLATPEELRKMIGMTATGQTYLQSAAKTAPSAPNGKA